jgi:hypothetical protein
MKRQSRSLWFPRCLVLGLGMSFVSAIGAGCGNDFDPYNRINSLRVLAIRSEPPAPGPGETTTLSALVFTPVEGTPVTYSWSWCPFAGPANAGYACQVTPEQAAMLAGAGVTLPGFDLGTGPTAQLANAIDPAILARLCAGQPGVPELPDCEGGFPVQVRLVVGGGGDSITSVRQLRLRFDPATPPNTNPHIDGLAATIGGADMPIGDLPALTLPRDEETVIKVQVPIEVSEMYRGKDDDDQIADVRERLIFSWFVESGDTDNPQTSFIQTKTTMIPLDRASRAKWTPGKTKDYPATTSRLIVVLRDNRGGVAWRSGIVTLGATP